MAFLFLLLFFMYIFPVIFLGVPVIRTSPIFATILLVLGIILWSIQTYKISKFISLPNKLAKKHLRVQENGKPVQAKILASEDSGFLEGDTEKKLLVSFPNLAGNQVKTYISLVDSKVHERRFEPGKDLDLRLNQNGFDPPLTHGGGQYQTIVRPWAWIWLVFNILYMIGFFLLSYYLQSDGYGWRFLNPFSPWLWAPLSGISTLGHFQGALVDEDIVEASYQFKSFKSRKDFGELLLYGQTTQGEIMTYGQTGLYINEQPQIRFNLKFTNAQGVQVVKTFKTIVLLTDLGHLKLGKVEVLYLPRRDDIFMAQYLDEE